MAIKRCRPFFVSPAAKFMHPLPSAMAPLVDEDGALRLVPTILVDDVLQFFFVAKALEFASLETIPRATTAWFEMNDARLA